MCVVIMRIFLTNALPHTHTRCARSCGSATFKEQVEGLALRKQAGQARSAACESGAGQLDGGAARTDFANDKHRPMTRSLVGLATLIAIRRGLPLRRLFARVLLSAVFFSL